MIGDIIYQALSSNLAVAALVGTSIYPEEAPLEADLPLVVYIVRLAEGGPEGTAPLARCTITANCYAATDAAADAIGAAVREVLDGFDGNGAGYQVRQLSLSDYGEVRDPEMALWGRLATFAGWIVQV